MTLFLTSSPTGPLDHSREVDGLDDKNSFPENLRRYWPERGRCLYLAAGPEEHGLNDMICRDMTGIFSYRGFPVTAFDVWDARTSDTSREILHSYDVLILGGGHVPTQNAFFQQLSLRKKLEGFEGLVLGISAGTMNASDEVYAQPELPGEATDPGYRRFLPGLGLFPGNVLPHYQMVKDSVLDGVRLFEDITWPDSFGRNFYALPDGSYILCREGRAELWGEGWHAADGVVSRLCGEGERRPLPLL